MKKLLAIALSLSLALSLAACGEKGPAPGPGSGSGSGQQQTTESDWPTGTVQFLLPAKAGGAGKLFGSVTSKEVSDALKAQFGFDIAKTKIVMADPIKAFGTYQLKCKLGYEISGTINVVVTEE